MCSNSTYQRLMDRVSAAGIEVRTIIDNVGQLVREETENIRAKRETDERSNRLTGLDLCSLSRPISRSPD